MKCAALWNAAAFLPIGGVRDVLWLWRVLRTRHKLELPGQVTLYGVPVRRESRNSVLTLARSSTSTPDLSCVTAWLPPGRKARAGGQSHSSATKEKQGRLMTCNPVRAKHPNCFHIP